MNEQSEPNVVTPQSLNPEGYVPIPAEPSVRDLFEALLRRPAQLAAHKACGEGKTLLRFGILAVASMLVFGFVVGTFAYGHQLWAAPLKLGIGLLFAGLICFPSLYIFSSLAGSTATAARMSGLLAGMLSLAGLLLLGFAPALWIFAQGTTSFGFMGVLALASWLLALVFAFRFIKTALRQTGATQITPILIWFSVFLLVTLQLSTTLRPILGSSDKFLTTEKKFFIIHWAETMTKSLDVSSDASQASKTGYSESSDENMIDE